MKTKINGVEIEGTPEEIGKMLGFTVVDLSTHEDIDCQAIYLDIQEEVDRIMNNSYVPCPPGYNPGFCCYDEDCNACREQWAKENWNLKGETT